MRKLLNWYFSKKSLPYWCILILDSAILFISGIIIYYLFHHRYQMTVDIDSLLNTLFVWVFCGAIFFKLFKTYSGIVRYSSFVDLLHIAYANGTAMLVTIALYYILPPLDMFAFLPPKIIIGSFGLATLVMWFVRILVKTLFDFGYSEGKGKRVLIYGAMSGGVGLAKNIRSTKPRRFDLRGFISHDSHYKNTFLMGERVYTMDQDLESVIKKENIEAVLISPLRIDDFRNEEDFQNMLIQNGIKIYMSQMAKEWNGDDSDMGEMQINEVDVEDLLPRDKIEVDMDAIGRLLQNRRILITGAAGSIGSEMVRQVAKYQPSEMILIDQAETPMHDVRLMMAKDYPDVKAHTIVTSICKPERMEEIFAEYRPEYVFHAAAYKHVPMMEDNPKEAIQNNVYGTRVIADLAVKYGTKKFVMISTDKAVNPTNVMGCSKRICEIYCQALNGAYPQPLPEGKGVAYPQPLPEGKGSSSMMKADPINYALLKDNAKRMRKNPTETEEILWRVLKNNSLGLHFRRQHVIHDFIVDFFCYEKNLSIEIDGGYHNEEEQKRYDEYRTQELNKLGIKELRFTNDDIIGDIDSVLNKIKETANDLPSLQGRAGVRPVQGETNSLPFREGAGVGCQFVTTRFGNVLGSNGSVIPLFREQIKNGGPVTVTHKDIIRYFMLIPEACKLVLEAGTMGKGGEIFVFDMGKPVRIMDLANRMIKLSGAKNVEIKVTGLRDGEKLYEEVLSDKEQTIPTVHPKIMVAKVREYAYDDILKFEKELYNLSFTGTDMEVVKKMKEIVPEFKSKHSKYEALD